MPRSVSRAECHCICLPLLQAKRTQRAPRTVPAGRATTPAKKRRRSKAVVSTAFAHRSPVYSMSPSSLLRTCSVHCHRAQMQTCQLCTPMGSVQYCDSCDTFMCAGASGATVRPGWPQTYSKRRPFDASGFQRQEAQGASMAFRPCTVAATSISPGACPTVVTGRE